MFLLRHPQALSLDFAFVQVILGIDVILNRVPGFPYFDYGWTFLLSAPNARVHGALLHNLFRLSSFPYRILGKSSPAGKNSNYVPSKSIFYICILILCRNPSTPCGSFHVILDSLTQIYVLLLSPSSPLEGRGCGNSSTCVLIKIAQLIVELAT